MDIAAYGWDHAQWTGSFYPEDLPPDWRLDYYCNEFRTVIVPAAHWQSLAESGLRSLAEQLLDETRLYLELGPRTAAAEVDQAQRVLGPQLVGFIARQPPPAAAAHSAHALGVWDSAGEGGCRCRWDEQRLPRCSGRGVATAWIGEEELALPHLRRIIERLAREAGDNPAVLVVDGAPPSLRTLRDALTLAELLGL